MLGRRKTKYIKYAIVTLLIMVVSLFSLVNPQTIHAAELKNRSITIGSATVNATTFNTYKFRISSGLLIGSLKMEYCTNSPFIDDVCTAPIGFSLASSSIGTQSGLVGFSIHPSSTANKLVLGRIPTPVVPPVDVSITVNSIANPNTANQTVYVRMSTYSSNDATGIRGDDGTTAFSTSRNISVGGFVPPFLIFCVGNTVAPNCSSTNGDFLSFGDFSAATTRTATSQFAVATNDPAGYVTALNGFTLTSGNNTIPALNVPSTSIIGISQFGINLKQNNSPVVGIERVGVGTGTVQPEFSNVNKFVFKNSNIVISTLPSDFNTFTVSYIANVAPDQLPGVYSATITYITMVLF